MLASSERSVGEIERQLRIPQPTVSKHFGCCAKPVSWKPPWTHSVVSTDCGQNHFKRWMPGWPSSASSGPCTSMLSNAISTAWLNPHQRKRRQGGDR
ncbi:MAG: helix-turn-helix transcriptional regulator [Acidobacteriaceae bacterium]|nr:helix-turn-helix transcriptional regulator [Acidobacteriaceae bacterium]